MVLFSLSLYVGKTFDKPSVTAFSWIVKFITNSYSHVVKAVTNVN